MYVPSLVKIHWRMLILECSQGRYTVKIWTGDIDLWPWKSIGFQTLLRSKYVPSLVKIHWRMLILECSQGRYTVKIWPGDIDLWPWKSIGFQTLLRFKYVPSLVKIHWRMLILECSQGCYVEKIWPLDLWPWKSIGFQTLLRTMHVHCTKFGQNPLKDVDSRVFTRMLSGKNLTRWHWPLTLKINRVPDSPKYVPSLVKIHWRMLILECSQGCYVEKIWPLDLWPWKSIGFQTLLRTMHVHCTKFGQNPLKDVDSRVFTRMLSGKNLTRWHWPLTLKINRVPDSPKYVPSLVKIHWRMLILECSQGCYVEKIWPLDLWPWKSIGFQTLLRTMHVHCTKFGQNPLKDVDSRVFTRMLRGKNLTRSHWPLTLKINRVPDSPKD